MPARTDIAPLLKRLPDTRGSRLRWEYVLAGKMRAVFANGGKTVRASDLLSLPLTRKH
jgi:hypothetical protein